MNIVRPTKDKGQGLFAGQQYEHGDMVEFNDFKRISYIILRDLDVETRHKLFADGKDIRYPQGNMVYVNHSKDNNCNVIFDRKYLFLIANQTIHKGDELTIDYGEGNTDF